MHGNSFYAPTYSITVTELTFMELMPVLTKFNKNVTNGLADDIGSQVDRVADTRPQVNRQRDGVSTHGILIS
jgi:hypothetical protein